MAEEASTKKGKYENMSQEAFEKKMQREMLGVVKKTEKMADAIHPGIDVEPTDASAANPVKGGAATKSEQEGRKK